MTLAADRLITKQAHLNNHFEALVHKEIKPFNWQNNVGQVQRITEQDRRKATSERKRRQKIAEYESRISRVKETEVREIPRHLLSPYRMDRLISIYCRVNDLTLSALMSPKKTKELSEHRHILFWILRNQTEQSTPQIGKKLNKDHSTVVHGVRKVRKNEKLLALAEEIKSIVLFFENEQFGTTEGQKA